MRLRSLVGASVLAAVFLNLALPPFNVWPLGLVCLLPLQLVASRVSVSRGVAVGFLYGVVTHVLGFRWLPSALEHGASLSPVAGVVGLLLFAAVHSVQWACALGLVAWWREGGIPSLIGFPLAIAASEIVFPHLLPWYTALAVQAFSPLMQLASVGGPVIITLALALFNVGLGHAWLKLRSGERRGGTSAAGVTVACACVVLAWGALRVAHLRTAISTASKTSFLLVQPGAQTEPLDTVRRVTLDALAAARGPTNPALIVWPETALGIALPIDDTPGSRQFVRESIFGDLRTPDEGHRFATPLLTGVVLENDGGPSARRFNAAVLVSTDGSRWGTYLKRDLAPVGEATPFEGVLPQLRNVFPPVIPFTPGGTMPPIRVENHVVDVSICYEDILVSQFADRVRAGRPELLVNLTSDAWLPAAASELHAALARFRAVEHGREILRVTTDGVTALISPTGEVAVRLPARVSAATLVEVHWLGEATVFAVVGAGPLLALLLASVVVTLKCVHTRRTRR